MKNIIKLIALLIAAAMTVSLFAACTDKKAEDTAATSGTEAVEVSIAADQTGEDQTAEDVSQTETDTEAEAIVTETEEETEPQQKTLYDVFRWDFDDATNMGWDSSSKTDIFSEEDGSMRLAVKGPDPNITSKKFKVKIDCDNVEYIVMRIKNMTNSYTGQIFISTTDSPGPDENYSYKYDYEFSADEYEDGEDKWEIIEIDTLDINGWTGTLRSLRLDYSDGDEGECYIDYIALQTSDEKKSGTGETEAEVDLRAGKQVVYTWDLTKLTSDDIYLASQPHDDETEGEGDEDTPDPRWHFSNGVEDAYVENGHLVIKIGGQDPFMMSPDIEEPFECDDVTAVVIKACNKSDMNLAQFFFCCDGASYSEAGSVKFSFEHKGADNDVWEEIVINPHESKLWTGNLESIRIDPSESWEGIVLIDSCELYG